MKPTLPQVWYRYLLLNTAQLPARNARTNARTQVYAAAKSMLGSSKLPVRMAGVSLSAALYAADGAPAKDDLGVEDLESRLKAQVRLSFCIVEASVRSGYGVMSSA